MSTARVFCIIFIITAYSTNDANAVDKYTDENRPYEFGFTIDGEQHRHEKKDENGLIMGEFGFITADGVYHVTVYATDENGRFKILSMKNIRVKPYPTAPTQSSRTGHSLSLPDTQNIESPSPVQTASFQANKNQPIINENSQTSPAQLQMPRQPASPIKSCSHCSLPTTTTKAPKLTDIIPQSYQRDQIAPNLYIKQDNNFNKNLAYQNTQQSQQGILKTPSIDSSVKYVNDVIDNSQASRTPEYRNTMNRELGTQTLEKSINEQYSGGNNINNENKPYSQQNGFQAPSISQNPSDQNYRLNSGKNIQEINPNVMQQSSIGMYNTQNQGINILNNRNDKSLESAYEDNQQRSQDYPQEERSVNLPSKPTSGDRNPKSYEPSLSLEQQNAFGPQSTPKLISAQMQIVDKNTDIYHKNAGESDGLPEGVSKDYIMRVLYVFNYTVGFHGHYEKGFSDGSKQGYYYVTGRNGIRTRVDYEADEKGFRPKITQEVLDLLSDDVPKPETEKEPKYGLKSYEFKWLYFPVESK